MREFTIERFGISPIRVKVDVAWGPSNARYTYRDTVIRFYASAVSAVLTAGEARLVAAALLEAADEIDENDDAGAAYAPGARRGSLRDEVLHHVQRREAFDA